MKGECTRKDGVGLLERWGNSWKDWGVYIIQLSKPCSEWRNANK